MARSFLYRSLPANFRPCAAKTGAMPMATPSPTSTTTTLIQRLASRRAAAATRCITVFPMTATKRLFVPSPSVTSRRGFLNKPPSSWNRVSARQASSSASNGRAQSSNGNGPTQSSLLMRMLQWYAESLETHPLTTKCVTSGSIAFVGDLICQSIVVHLTTADETAAEDINPDDSVSIKNNNQSPQEELPASTFFGFTVPSPRGMEWWDVARSIRFSMQGVVLVGPIVHAWYQCLAIYVPGTSIARVLSRVALDQFVFHPPFLALRIGFLWFLEEKATVQTADDKTWAHQILYDVFPQFLPITWCIWIPCLCINFRFIPLKFQLLFTNVVSLVWNTAFSYDQARQQQAQHVAKPKVLKQEEEIAVGLA